MNLEDAIDPEYGLQQDDYSQSGVVFGEEGQLEVVGWSGKSSSNNKYYIIKCSKCSEDRELFGEGYFKVLKGNLLRGKTSCGCCKRVRWSKEQYEVLCSRKAKELGYSFVGFKVEWKGQNTKIKMLCNVHGEWGSATIHNLTCKNAGCPSCCTDIFAENSRKPDEEMIASFLASGAFHPETKFWRSDRTNKLRKKYFWFVSCPECGEIGESIYNSLQEGGRPCACSKHRQQEAYINLVLDDKNTGIAIKFGIANNSKYRTRKQNSKSVYEIINYLTYTFPDVESCKKAERECKKELECGIVLKRDMPDGWTETTWLYNLEKIKSIYEKHGGVIKEGHDKAKLLF